MLTVSQILIRKTIELRNLAAQLCYINPRGRRRGLKKEWFQSRHPMPCRAMGCQISLVHLVLTAEFNKGTFQDFWTSWTRFRWNLVWFQPTGGKKQKDLHLSGVATGSCSHVCLSGVPAHVKAMLKSSENKPKTSLCHTTNTKNTTVSVQGQPL